MKSNEMTTKWSVLGLVLVGGMTMVGCEDRNQPPTAPATPPAAVSPTPPVPPAPTAETPSAATKPAMEDETAEIESDTEAAAAIERAEKLVAEGKAEVALKLLGRIDDDDLSAPMKEKVAEARKAAEAVGGGKDMTMPKTEPAAGTSEPAVTQPAAEPATDKSDGSTTGDMAK